MAFFMQKDKPPYKWTDMDIPDFHQRLSFFIILVGEIPKPTTQLSHPLPDAGEVPYPTGVNLAYSCHFSRSPTGKRYNCAYNSHIGH
jgi:hypothetical protein